MARSLRRPPVQLGCSRDLSRQGRKGVSMRSAILGLTILLLPGAVGAQSVEQQIAEAVLPLPEGLRAGARVITVEADAKHSVLREGTNDWVCETDEPTEGFSVSCFRQNFYPLRQRNRELRGQGMAATERLATVAAEIKSGKLKVADYSMSFHLDGINRRRALPLANVRIPFATPESTGLLTEPDDHRPWLMGAGTASAHIMLPGQ